MEHRYIVKEAVLPHEGLTRGGRGHPQIKHPKGTPYFVVAHECDTHREVFFWSGYLRREQAERVAARMGEPDAVPHQTMIAFNFKRDLPLSVCRPDKEIR